MDVQLDRLMWVFLLFVLLADGSFVVKERVVVTESECYARLARYGNDFRLLENETGRVASCQPLRQAAAR